MYMGMGTGQIFIQQVGYEGATTRNLPALLTSLVQTQPDIQLAPSGGKKAGVDVCPYTD